MHRYLTTALISVAAFALGAAVATSVPSQAAMSQMRVQIIRANGLFAGLQQLVPGVWGKTLAGTSSADVAAFEISSVKSHTHNNTNEFIYVVDGTAQATVGGKSVTLQSGDFVVLPKGIPHSLRSMGSKIKIIGFETPPMAPNDMHMMK